MIASALFALAAVGYWGAAIGFQVHLQRTQNRDWKRWSLLVLASQALHTLGLVALTVQLEHLPMTHMREALAVLSWLLVTLHILVGRRWKVEALGSVAAPVAAVLTTFTALTVSNPQPVAPRGGWFLLHVGSLSCSYAAFSLAAGSALLYFIQARRLKSKRLAGAFQLPSLDTLDRVAFRFILVGLPLLLLGIVSGMLIRGWQWSWDIKGVLVAVTGVFYLIYLYLRIIAGWQGRRINLVLLGAYAFVMLSLIAPGRFHQY